MSPSRLPVVIAPAGDDGVDVVEKSFERLTGGGPQGHGLESVPEQLQFPLQDVQLGLWSRQSTARASERETIGEFTMVISISVSAPAIPQNV